MRRARLGPSVFRKTAGRQSLAARLLLAPYTFGSYLSFLWHIRGEEAWPPERVAAAAFDAIREERFYVIPAQEEVKAGLYQRLDEVRDQRNPQMPGILADSGE